MNKDFGGETIQVMPVGSVVDAHLGGALDVTGYRVIVFDAEVTLTVGGNTFTWPVHKELGVAAVASITVTAANYMAI